MRQSIHVLRSGGAWVVQTAEGYSRTRYLSQEFALTEGAALAASEGLDMVLHDRRGKIKFRLFSPVQRFDDSCSCKR